MILYFQNSFGVRREIGRPGTAEDIHKIINDFLEDHKYKSYYTRSWVNETKPEEKFYDVGSHSEFFICYKPGGWNNE